MIFDINNIYSGSYTLGANSSMTLAGQALTAGTTLSTGSINQSPSATPFGTDQVVQAGLGEPMAVLLQITAATAGSGAITVNLVTDNVYTLNSAALATLASLPITNPATAVTPVGTTFVLVLPPNLNFLKFSGIQYVLAGSAAMSVFATQVPVRFLPGWTPYQSGWVIQNQ